MNVLVTGAGGSIGSALVKKLLEQDAIKVKAFDIDEYSLATLARNLNNDHLATCEGDVKDVFDVEYAMRDCNTVVHIAAAKMVDISSNNPVPCLKTNVDGMLNLINQALRQKTSKFLFISSDKAVDFASVYGASKFIGERLTVWANHIGTGKYSVCRMGNVIESRGNVFEIWKEQKDKKQPITLTHALMERYFWHVNEAVTFILKSLELMKGGEIFIPKMTKYKMIDLAHEYSTNIKYIGLRPDEQLDARLFAPYEEAKLKDYGSLWVLKP